MGNQENRIQESLYNFPYHYLPTIDSSGTISIHKSLLWGLDYLTYMNFIDHIVSDQLRPTSLLDIGCGDGRLIHMLTGKVPQLNGVDISENAIRFAKAFNPTAEFYSSPLSDVPGQYDVITLIEVLEHVENEKIQDLLNSISKRLIPLGKLVISVPTENVVLNPKHYRHYNYQLIKEQLEPYFSLESYWYITKKGLLFNFLNSALQNHFGIILSTRWRRTIWRIHKRFTYLAGAGNGIHLVALATSGQNQPIK